MTWKRAVIPAALLAVAFVCGSFAVLFGASSVHRPKTGEAAPLFEGIDQNGHPVRLEEYRGKRDIVLYFYPKDGTPGCTAQACSLRDGYRAIQAAGAEVIGVSADTEASHASFSREHNLPFPIVADPDRRIIRQYGVAMPLFGISRRITFVIGRDGVIRTVISDPGTRHHDRQVLESLRKAG
jgi:peroxiredoxin Q/BCP